MSDRVRRGMFAARAWLLWRPVRAVAALTAAAALVVAAAVVSVHASAARLTNPTGPTQTAAVDEVESPAPVDTADAACAEAARAWTVALTDKASDDKQWRAVLLGLTSPTARQQLAGVRREGLPTGPVKVTSAVSQPGSCDASVTVGGSPPLMVQATPSGAGWIVSGWGAP